MLVKQVNRLGFEPFERGFDNLFDVPRLTVQTALLGAVTIEPEFGGDDHLSAKRSEGFAHKLFICERTIDLGGVEESHAVFDGRSNQGDHLLPISSRTIAKAHAHAAKTKGRDFQITFSEFALLHNLILSLS